MSPEQIDVKLEGSHYMKRIEEFSTEELSAEILRRKDVAIIAYVDKDENFDEDVPAFFYKGYLPFCSRLCEQAIEFFEDKFIYEEEDDDD